MFPTSLLAHRNAGDRDLSVATTAGPRTDNGPTPLLKMGLLAGLLKGLPHAPSINGFNSLVTQDGEPGGRRGRRGSVHWAGCRDLGPWGSPVSTSRPIDRRPSVPALLAAAPEELGVRPQESRSFTMPTSITTLTTLPALLSSLARVGSLWGTLSLPQSPSCTTGEPWRRRGWGAEGPPGWGGRGTHRTSHMQESAPGKLLSAAV
jgi:hypothetical protein